MIAKRAPRRTDSKDSFTQLVSYIADEKNQGNKVAEIRITNCASDDLAFATREIEFTQASNQRAKSDKSYHLILSFRAGENPAPETLAAIENEVCDYIGLGEHQRISAVHTDTDNLHIHIAINKIHPRSLRLVEPYYDKMKLSDICQAMEHKYNLETDNHISEERKSEITGRSADMESHSGLESFLGYVKEKVSQEAVSLLENGADWQSLHSLMAKYNLEIRERGNGLVIASKENSLSIKASSVHKHLSKSAITQVMGEYQAANESVKAITPEESYQAKPLHQLNEDRQALYSRYLSEKNESIALRREQLTKVREARQKELSGLKIKYKHKRAELISRRTAKRAMYSILKMERIREDAEIRSRYTQMMRDNQTVEPVKSWQEFLLSEAGQGNEVALSALRRNKRRKAQEADSANSLEAAKVSKKSAEDSIYTKYTFFVHKDGAVTYRFDNGGSFRDEGKRLVLGDNFDKKSIETALKMAMVKYGNNLKIKGSTEFVALAEKLAKANRIKVSSAQMDIPKNMENSAEKVTDQVEKYMKSRNNLIDRVSDISKHRLFKDTDSGSLVYKGQRQLDDGSRLALFDNDNETLCLPVTSAQAAKLAKKSVGSDVTIDRRGRIISTSRGL
ncbi:TraI/MobA(P) family conjugative relaxase [Kistimonas asteriae]|uniref:TraI/MobA(P) family conjugative relaxase n=1 Tax=Kistimonas asteriae TaxID=517724 RepID=UPI001BA7F985|nr:TraI/MobA(P) family conjugative relaxase [Kistimonas asteriae]